MPFRSDRRSNGGSPSSRTTPAIRRRRPRPASTSISRTTACRTRPCCTLPTPTTAKAACCSIPTSGPRTARWHSPTIAPSPDGKLLAYAQSEAGSDWQQIFLVDVATGKQLADQLKWARFSDIAWATRWQRLLLQPLSRAGAGRAVPVRRHEPDALLPQARRRAGRPTR